MWFTGTHDSTDRLTDHVCPSHVILMLTLPPHATLIRVVVNSVVSSSGDSYKTENADDWKAKSRGDTRATNCEAGTRERPANLFILALPC